MDIFDEQVPFTVEQIEYLTTRFVSKNSAWNKLNSDVQGKSTFLPKKEFGIDWARKEFPEKHQEMTENRAIAFLKKLSIEGGEIVCSAGCSSSETALAHKEDRFFVADGLGYVLRPMGWNPLPIDARSLN
jgi:hypothetical protein